MPVYTLDPLRDPRWPEFLDRHSSASVFHSRGWLDALRTEVGENQFAALLAQVEPQSQLIVEQALHEGTA